ncbi:MAG: hypothetical protein IPJ69_14600 [Deltaproteobacteria bacterium]|nr:MAG: hypothetical protein IPJ69_14600 [Deltaproteobacteria bacterium]
MLPRVTQGPFIFHAPSLGPGDGLGDGALSPTGLSTGLPSLEANVPTGSAIFAPVRGADPLPRVGFIQDIRDLKPAFSLLEKLGGPWKNMLEASDRLRDERVARGDVGSGGEAFRITVVPGGTFCRRGEFQDRRRELADELNLDPGQSVFGLVHELTHALPLEVLFPELAQLPYRDLSDLGHTPSLEEAYYYILQSLYQDEAISCLAEILLYRDLVKADYDVTSLETLKNLEEIKRGLKIYEKEGIVGYLRSEIYIGRNHRSSYSHHRAMALAAMAACDPKILNDPSALTLLEEHGVSVQGDRSKLSKAIHQIASAFENLTPGSINEAMTAVGEAMTSGLDVSLDYARVMAIVSEAFALRTGTQRKASDSFLGRREEVHHQVQMASAVVAARKGEVLGKEPVLTVFADLLHGNLGTKKGFYWDDGFDITGIDDNPILSNKAGVYRFKGSKDFILSIQFLCIHWDDCEDLRNKNVLDDSFKDENRFFDFRYYFQLKDILNGKKVKIQRRDFEDSQIDDQRVVALQCPLDYYPDSFRRLSALQRDAFVVSPMTALEENAHLGLEMLKRGLVPYSCDYLNPSAWGMHATFVASPANQWICHRLALDWIVQAEKHGDTEYAEAIRGALKDLFTGSLGSQFPEVCLQVERERETFEWLLPLHRSQSAEDRSEFLDACLREYEQMIDLGRATHLAGTVAIEIREWTHDARLRPQVVRLLELCIRLTATYDIHTESFRRSFGTLFEVIDQADWTHHEKEKLLLALMQAGLEREHFAPAGGASMARSLRAFEWAENHLLSNAMLARVGHYSQVEAFLLEKYSRF